MSDICFKTHKEYPYVKVSINIAVIYVEKIMIATKVSPYNTTSKIMTRNKNKAGSIPSDYRHKLVADRHLAFPENLPILARCASIEIMITILGQKTFFAERSLGVYKF